MVRKLIRPSLKEITDKYPILKPEERPKVPDPFKSTLTSEKYSSDNPPPYQTFKETYFLQELVDKKSNVKVRLIDNTEISGVIEYYDKKLVRITRNNKPNAFILKYQIKYIEVEK